MRWIETRGRPLQDGEWIGVSIDVTDRRGAEQALREANEQLEETVARLDTLLANAPIGFAFFDAEYQFVLVNQLLAETNGVSVEEHLGRRLSDILPDVGPQVEAVLDTVRETGAPIVDFEISGHTPAQPGVERHWLANYYPVRSPDGGLLGFGSMIVEITERKRQERAAASHRRGQRAARGESGSRRGARARRVVHGSRAGGFVRALSPAPHRRGPPVRDHDRGSRI